MTGKALNHALQKRSRVYGTLVVSPSPHWPAIIRAAGLDYVFIDTEHIALDRGMLSWMCQTYQALGIAPVVRIPSPDPYQACIALDGGAVGVVAPYIETAEEVRKLVGAVKQRPLKGEKLRQIVHGESEAEDVLDCYVRERNAANSLIINIESIPAMQALDDILAVPGLDAILIGPHDLSCSLGIPEDYTHPRFLDAVAQIIQTACQHNKSAGIHVVFPDIEQEIHWIKAGANLILHSGDILLFKEALRTDIETLRASIGETKMVEAEEYIVV